MANRISDRLQQFQQTVHNTSGLSSPESIGKRFESLARTETCQADLDVSFSQLLQSHLKPTETVVLGVSRFAPWNKPTQTAFLHLFQQADRLVHASRSLAVVPWKLFPRETDSQQILSLENRENTFDPTLVSRVLRELPIWKRGKSLIVLELGRLDSELARSLSRWCDLTLLVTYGLTSIPPRQCRILQNWSKAGYPLDAAVHVA